MTFYDHFGWNLITICDSFYPSPDREYMYFTAVLTKGVKSVTRPRVIGWSQDVKDANNHLHTQFITFYGHKNSFLSVLLMTSYDLVYTLQSAKFCPGWQAGEEKSQRLTVQKTDRQTILQANPRGSGNTVPHNSLRYVNKRLVCIYSNGSNGCIGSNDTSYSNGSNGTSNSNGSNSTFPPMMRPAENSWFLPTLRRTSKVWQAISLVGEIMRAPSPSTVVDCCRYKHSNTCTG